MPASSNMLTKSKRISASSSAMTAVRLSTIV
jgi:hypothetical protein